MKKNLLSVLSISIVVLTSPGKIFAQNISVPIDSQNWDKTSAREVEFLGRKSLIGTAFLKDIEFRNGVIEFDLAVNGERSYPGVTFRMRGDKEYERIYIRPHLSKVFQNVVQYEGTFNGLDSWQLYYGPGKTCSARFPVNEWFHVKIEVLDSQARLYISDMNNPVLHITSLAHGISKGTIGLLGPADGSAFFSNFSYRDDDSLIFPPEPLEDNPVGIISDWEISKPDMILNHDMELYPSALLMQKLEWKKVKAHPSGLVDISRHYGRIGQLPDLIWAKTDLYAGKEEVRKVAFGYSDVITVFLNGKAIFSGNSEYTSRDANFQGIIGYNDFIYLPLKKGKNELMIALAESFGGWGFMFMDANAVYEKPGITKIAEIKNRLRIPESAVYDSKRDVLYVSNYTAENNGFISKVKLNGEIEKIDFIGGIMQPTGLAVKDNKLLIVGRYNLIEYDLDSNKITGKYPFPQPQFANDISIDEAGNIYVSDGPKGTIYMLTGYTPKTDSPASHAKFTEWLSSPCLKGINGIVTREGKIYAGVSSDGSIKIIDTGTKELKTVFTFGKQTIMDGLAFDNQGNILFSDNDGRLFRLTPEVRHELILNTKTPKMNIADFCYIPQKQLLVIPTFYDNRLIFYKVN
ncbi:MAG: hypothetical protein AB9922_11205 [Bacteroidales bacterium]